MCSIDQTDGEQPEGQQSRSPVLKEAQGKANLIECITECQSLAPPVGQLNADIQDQYSMHAFSISLRFNLHLVLTLYLSPTMKTRVIVED